MLQIALILVAFFCGFFLRGADVRAGSIRLKSGLEFSGKVVSVDARAVNAVNRTANPKNPRGSPIWFVDDGPRILFVPGSQVVSVDDSNKSLLDTTFVFKQIQTGQAIGPTSVGGFSRVEEFDEHGHGMVQLRTTKGTQDIYLGISELRPDYFTIKGLSHDWTFYRTTQSLPAETLDRMLRSRVDPSKPVDRRKLIVFYERAQRYDAARQEVQQFAEDFPSEKAWCDETLARMNDLDSQRILNELRRRQLAGQHQIVDQLSRSFPAEGVTADVRTQVDSIIQDYNAARERRAALFLHLDMLQAQLPMETAMKLKPLRSLIDEELHAVENIVRMKAFEQFADAEDLKPEQKLARAFSSWVVGSTYATESLPTALRMWDLRFLVLEYMRTADQLRRAEIVKQIEEMEDFSVEILAAMVEFLPMLEESDPIPPGVPTAIETTDLAGDPVKYTLILPKEYNRAHEYPLLVTLCDGNKTPESEAKWWAGDTEREGQAQRRGFITIAPQYSKSDQRGYEYDHAAHRAVLGAIRHAMRTHRVDADRVVLVGHGSGADACFDIGMSHPDLFAGVGPICGRSTNYCKFYYPNGLDTAWYVTAGQLDRDTVAENERDLNRYFSKGIEIIYSEYKQRGYESYSEELPRLMDWAETVRRKPIKEFVEFEAKTMRFFDNRFHWIQSGSLPAEMSEPVIWSGDRKSKRDLTIRTISGKVTSPGGTIYVSHPGDTVSIWLSPQMFSAQSNPFENRIRVHVNKVERFNGVVKPSAESLLEDLRVRSDRKRVFWARLDLKKG